MPPARRAAPVDWRLTPSPERPPRNGPPGDAAPDLVTIPDTPYDGSLWTDSDDEGLGARDRRAP